MPGHGATPVSVIVRVSTQKFPRPIASIVGRGTTGNGCVARKAARCIGKVTVQKKPRAFQTSDQTSPDRQNKMRRENGPRADRARAGLT